MGLKTKVKKILVGFKNIFTREVKTPIYIPIIKGEILSGKSILITGGAGGIGYAIAVCCVENGATVVLAGRNEKKLMDAKLKLIEETKCEENRVFTIILDVQNVSSFKEKIEDVVEKLPSTKLDILVNNAGISKGGVIGETSEEGYDITLDTNLKGTFFLSQEFANYLIHNKIKGNILNITSSSGVRPAITPYMISKWGVTGLTEGLAKKLIKHDIVVNGIAPGPTATEMLESDGTDLMYAGSPAKRYAAPIEIGNLAVFLISDMGRMIVGDTVYITGGCGTLTLDDIEY